MIVKVLEIPVRYQGVTHPAGQVFEMEEEHFNEKIVREATEEEAEEMVKYSKAADRSGIVKPPVDVEDYSKFTEAELNKIKKDDLKAYLDSKEIDYASDAIKEELVQLILGE